jgi:hypothetical protein
MESGSAMSPDIKKEPADHSSAGALNPLTRLPPHRDADLLVATDLSRHNASLLRDLFLASPRPVPLELVNEAEELSEMPKLDERLVGFVGASGAGKSSLICALLENKDVATVDGSGNAVTCFPIYYRDRPGENKTKYEIRCLFRHSSDIDEVLESYLDDFNAADDAENDEAPSAQIDESGEVAEATLQTLFSQIEGFDLNQLLIGKSPNVTRETAMHALRQWASCLEWPQGIVQGLWTREVQDEEELREVLTKFSASGLWPLIDHLTIYLDAPLLRNGVVLVDLPGYHDSNYARERVARETQQKCSDVFVVAHITRVVDSPILQQVVKENTPRPNTDLLTLQTITVVCTHSAVPARDIEKNANAQTIRAARARLAALIKNNGTPKDVTRAGQQILKIIVAARNKKVNEELQHKYASKLGVGKLNVFCVDSALWIFPDEDMGDEPDEEICGIAQLQIHIEKLPGRALFRVNNALIGSRYRAMVCSFESWVSNSRVRPSGLNSILPEPKALKNFEQRLRLWDDAVTGTFDRLVLRKFRSLQPQVNNTAYAVAKNWRKTNHNTVRAICKREGCYIARKSQTLVVHDWNQELMCSLEAFVAADWAFFDGQLRGSLDALEQMIYDAFQDYPRECRELGAPEHFLQGIRSRQETLDAAASTTKSAFIHWMGTIRRNSFISQELSYITQVMRPAYKKACQDRGEWPRNKDAWQSQLTGCREGRKRTATCLPRSTRQRC